MRHSYPECPTLNIGTICTPASYKILLRLEQKDVTKEFPSVCQYSQSLRNFISSLIEVTVGNDMKELVVESCSQMLTVETVHKHWLDYDFAKLYSNMFS